MLLSFVNIRHIKFIAHQLAVVLLFTALYYIGDLYVSYYEKDAKGFKHSNKKRLTLFDYFRFSLITQTTVGYGEMSASHTITEIINTIQLLTIYGIIFFTI